MTEWLPIEGVTVLGFGCKARNGKDSVAQFVHEHVPGSRQYSFASALKAVCRVQFGMTLKDGPLLQMVGTDLYRRQNPNVWIDAVYWQLVEERPALALITDVRFPNEAEFVKALGGVVCRVDRYNEDGSRFIDPSRPANHPSEIALDDYQVWDYVIRNDRTLGALRVSAIQMFNDFKARRG